MWLPEAQFYLQVYTLQPDEISCVSCIATIPSHYFGMYTIYIYIYIYIYRERERERERERAVSVYGFYT